MAKHGISPAMAERVGLLVPRSSGSGHYDRFRHRLMFAVLDVSGRVIAFSGRALPEPSEDELHRSGLRPSTTPDDKPAKYINSPESPIYTKGEHLFGLYQARQTIRQTGEAVLVEGNFDVDRAARARYPAHVAAPLGTAFTEQQAQSAQAVRAERDRSCSTATRREEGDVAARIRARPRASPPRRRSCRGGMDPDELAQKRAWPPSTRCLKERAARSSSTCWRSC